MTNSISPSLNRINKVETEQSQSTSTDQKDNQTDEIKSKNEKLNGFPDDFPHHSINSDLINLTSQNPTGSNQVELLYHGTTVKKNQSKPQSTNSSHVHQDSYSRKCWICYDDDEDEDDHSQTPHNSSDRKSTDHKKKWAKACRCSLVAHESCLLTWITTYQLTHPIPPTISSPLLTPVKCPQCSFIYQISQPSSPILSLIHQLRRPYQTAISWCSLGLVILGLGVSASSYGLWASRCFLGSIRWNHWILNSQNSGGLNLLKFFQLSLVGPILILSRTKQLDSILPFLPISLIFSTLPPLSLDSDLDETSNLIKFEQIFPPEPGLTLCLIPWMRIGWNLIWSRISDFVIDREYNGMNYQYPIGLGLGGRGGAIVEANENNPVEPINNHHEPVLNQDEELNERAAAEVVFDYSSLRTILRIGMEALLWPGAASIVGSILLLLSKKRKWLQTLLGLKTNYSFINQATYSLNNSSSTSINFFKSIKSSISQLIYKMTKLDYFSTSTNNSINLMGFSFVDGYDDPVWWRNILGGSLLVIIKDLLTLIEKVLCLRKLGNRRIIDVESPN